MVYYFITSRSLTAAQRTAGILRRRGIRTELIRVPREFANGGCTSAVKVDERDIEAALIALREAGNDGVRVYIRYADGSGREIELS